MEGVYKDRYKRETFLVLGEDDKLHPAELYRVIDPKGPFPPSRNYVEIMLTGARELKLAPEYIKKIEESILVDLFETRKSCEKNQN